MKSRSFLIMLSLAPALAQDAPVPKFEPQTIDDAIKIGYGLAIGDVDGDSKPDIVLADKKEIVWYQNPSWKKHLIARDLTLMDNVCVAARDIDGDGRVEVAVGAQWNPGETSDEAKSGAVFYLIRPDDLSQPWKPVKLPHEPTVHRMKWVRGGDDRFQLVVVPLHGRGNNPQTGAGVPVKVTALEVPANRADAAAWTVTVIDQSLHKTHNFDVRTTRGGAESFWLGGLEGVQRVTWEGGQWRSEPIRHEGMERGIGEIRVFGSDIIALIQPMHGNQVVVYHEGFAPSVLDESLAQGHALVCQPLLGRGFPEVVAGWRERDGKGEVGLRMWVRDDSGGSEKWMAHVIDQNAMACEDMAAADLDGDQRTDLIASGRSTHNVIVYWNRTAAARAASRDRPELPPLSDAEAEAAKKRRTKE